MGKTRSSKVASEIEPPAEKKSKLDTSCDSSTSTVVDTGFLAAIESKRKQFSPNILQFKFNKKRCRLISKSMDVGDSGGGILYWMSREQRVQGNIFF